jgi:hypothetical protein
LTSPRRGEGRGGGAQFIFILRDALVGYGGLDSHSLWFEAEGQGTAGIENDDL